MVPPRVILWGYPESPYAMKVRIVLALRRIPFTFVKVARIPPRPELIDLLGITYRRIPIAAIDGEVYCDTSAICDALEEHFKEEDGYASLLQPAGEVQRAAANWWAEKQIFGLASVLLPWGKMPEAFVKDRSDYSGATINVKQMAAIRPAVASTWLTHLRLVENQLARHPDAFIMGTPSPMYLDVSLFFTLDWVSSKEDGDAIFGPIKTAYPNTLKWIERMRQAIHKAGEDAPKVETVDGAEAARRIINSNGEGNTKSCTISQHDPIIAAGWLRAGQEVEVTPKDTGKVPQRGMLVGFTDEKISLDVSVPEKGKTVRVHFPRIGFDVKPSK